MFATDHHGAFENWWKYARDNYVSWDGENAVGVDLYYDPVVDEHVGNGPMGLIAPCWYFAPQKPEVAMAGWQTAASFNGVFGDGPITGLEDPGMATMLLQIAGEFADASTKQRLWEAADPHIEPVWDRERGEFTLGFGLNEAHPRGQWNARTMAGWVCEPGAWARIFHAPNLEKFAQPTVSGVDFPRFALSQAQWDGQALHLALQPQNAAAAGATTRVKISNLPGNEGWVLRQSDGGRVELETDTDGLAVELVADNQPVSIVRSTTENI
jgi:hypothetical protein